MGTLILIRHGRTPANAQGILAGRAPGVELDDEGRKSAIALQSKFSGLEISKVFASPLIRTQQTARLVFPGLEIEQADDLIECEYGDWTGKKLSELAKDPLWPLVQNSPDKVTFPNGESMQNMSDRATAQIQNIDLGLTEQYGENFIWAAVSHGDVIKAVIASALGLELSKFQKIYVEPASVSVIRYNKGDSSVVKVNDTGDGWVEQLAKLAEPALGGQTGATED